MFARIAWFPVLENMYCSMEVHEAEQVVLQDCLVPFPIHGGVPGVKVQSPMALAPEKHPHTITESGCSVFEMLIHLNT